MASVIIMPKQGLLMEEGTITNWLVKEGEKTTEGTPLFEMETDKLTITMDSTATGTMLKILHPEGDTVPITQPIAIVGEPGENISALLGGEAPAAAPAAGGGARAAEVARHHKAHPTVVLHARPGVAGQEFIHRNLGAVGDVGDDVIAHGAIAAHVERLFVRGIHIEDVRAAQGNDRGEEDGHHHKGDQGKPFSFHT